MEGVAAKKALLDRYNEIAVNYSDETADEMAKLQDEIDGQEPVGPRLPGRPGDGRAALPAGRRRRRRALRRRAPPRRALPAAAGAARTAAARRADQPSRRRVGALAGRPPAQLSGRDPDRHPRPLLPRQRHRLDPRARSRPRHSLRGQLLGLAGAEAEAARAGGPRGGGAPAHARPRAGMDRGLARAPGRPSPRRAISATRNCSSQGGREADPDRADRHPGGRAARARTSSTSSTSRRASATTC